MDITLPAEMTDLALWTAVVSFFAPAVLDLIIQSNWSKRAQSLIAFAASAVIGVTTAFFSGAFTGLGIVTAILLAFVVTITAYKGFWKPVAPELKDATTVGMQKGVDGVYRTRREARAARGDWVK